MDEPIPSTGTVRVALLPVVGMGELGMEATVGIENLEDLIEDIDRALG